MKPSSLKILYFFICFRLSRKFSSNKIPSRRIKSWKKNISRSKYYNSFIRQKEKFPVINKSIFMDKFDEINTLGVTKHTAFDVALRAEKTRDFSETIGDISVGLSSGTSGNRGIFLTSIREREMWVGSILDRVIGFSFKKRNVAFFLRANSPLYEAVKSKILAFHFFDIQLDVRKQLDQLISVKPNILVAQPSVLIEIAKAFKEKKITWQFNKILSVAEVLEEDQKSYMESVFRQRIDQVYQCTEGFLAHTCQKGKLHFNEDWLHIEKNYLDNKRFHPIITDYLRSSQPVIRYELNDIIHEGGPCDCGLKSTVIEKIEGRSDDVFRFHSEIGELVIYPDFIRRAIIGSSPDILNFVVVRKEKLRIELSLELDHNAFENEVYSKAKQALSNILQEVKGLRIEKSQFRHDPINKFRRIRNEYKEEI